MLPAVISRNLFISACPLGMLLFLFHFRLPDQKRGQKHDTSYTPHAHASAVETSFAVRFGFCLHARLSGVGVRPLLRR